MASEGGTGRNQSHSTRDDYQGEDGPVEGNVALKQKFRDKSKKKEGVKMSPKVLETWLNETLQDAEHLDIPGVALKPESKNPITRYHIDRPELILAGLDNEMVDRIYRALFVYSVGFYELIKKCLEHTKQKYTVVTSLWKVFSILLEYCCRTDYRMLIQKISEQSKDERDELEAKYAAKFEEQANAEKELQK